MEDLILIVPIKKLMNDNIPNYDWYFYEVRVQTVPGKVSYNSDWETAGTHAWHKAFLGGIFRWLVDYNPTTTVGTSIATVTLGAEAGPEGPSAGFSTSWSYSIPYVKVIDKSDFSEYKAYWEHDFDEKMALPHFWC